MKLLNKIAQVNPGVNILCQMAMQCLTPLCSPYACKEKTPDMGGRPHLFSIVQFFDPVVVFQTKLAYHLAPKFLKLAHLNVA